GVGWYGWVEGGGMGQVRVGVRRSGGGDARRGKEIASAERYVVALGTVEPRKNLPTLVRAFDRIAGRDPELRLVVAGADGWGAEGVRSAWNAAKHAHPGGAAREVSDTDPPRPPAGAPGRA